MTRRIALLIAAGPLLLAAASAPIGFDAEPIDVEVKRARQEAQAAEADMRRLDQAAAKARGDAARLAAERRTAAAAIAASEASISAADAQVRLAEAQVAMRSARLAERQSPLAALLAGVVSMGRRPPLLSVADSSSVGEIVRVRALLDTTLPVIRARTASLSGELAESRRAQSSARDAREQLNDARRELQRRQQRFAALEEKAAERAAKIGAGAVEAADVMVGVGPLSGCRSPFRERNITASPMLDPTTPRSRRTAFSVSDGSANASASFCLARSPFLSNARTCSRYLRYLCWMRTAAPWGEYVAPTAL